MNFDLYQSYQGLKPHTRLKALKDTFNLDIEESSIKFEHFAKNYQHRRNIIMKKKKDRRELREYRKQRQRPNEDD